MDTNVVNNEKGRTYSLLYYITAIFHIIYAIIFSTDKLKSLVIINIVLAVIYLIVAYYARKAISYSGVFVVCTISMTFFLVSHYVLLGPSFGFQYFSIGMIPFMFFLAYVNGGGVELARNGSIVSYILYSIVSMSCTHIQYPILNVSETSRRIVGMINISITFFLSIRFMSEFVRKTYKDAGALENKNLDLEKSASIDALTGLLNRRTVEAYIKRAIYLALGEGTDFSILMCDLDNFKKINDTYGHDCGDLVLKNIAQVIKSETRPQDAVFRWGGEEILMVINSNGYVAKTVAERCRKSIEESSVNYNGEEIKVTITIGGSSYYRGATRDDLINRADKNLYEGKQNGKNQVVM